MMSGVKTSPGKWKSPGNLQEIGLARYVETQTMHMCASVLFSLLCFDTLDCKKPVPIIHKGSVLEQMEEENEATTSKCMFTWQWPLKRLCLYFSVSFTHKLQLITI